MSMYYQHERFHSGYNFTNASDFLVNKLQHFRIPASKCTFPDDKCMPAHGFEFLYLSRIPSAVSFELQFPEVRSALRNGRASASGMMMPEAAMYEYSGPVPREDDVRMPRKESIVESVPESLSEQVMAQLQLGDCVLPADMRHYLASLLLADVVHDDANRPQYRPGGCYLL
jgi:hypothetical protein